MLKTFNCGIGFVIVIKKKNYKQITKYFKFHNTRFVELGIVQKGKRKNKVEFKNLDRGYEHWYHDFWKGIKYA